MIKIKYAIVIIILLLIAVFLYYQDNKLDVTRYRIQSEDIKDKVKILHLSDMHSKPFKKVLAQAQKIKPDLIMIIGDYVNDRNRNKDKMLEFGRELTKISRVYYITGNHERRLENFEELMQELKGVGFNVLRDEMDSIEVKGSKINILGLDENQASRQAYADRKKGIFEYKDESALINELSRKDGFKIILSHFPENFEMIKEMNYVCYDFDLQLSGHAHGGQFILPLIGSVYSPGQGLFPKYAKGSFGTRPKLIISRGIGNAEFPFRLFNHPEIIVINLTRKLN
ncbi:MAG: metallophosphoesterase [Eubacterium sp.]|nr:metallophosphoesterase [Eubacterium sp.]